MVNTVTKRSGHTVKFNINKIVTAITKANRDVKNSDSTARIMTKKDIEYSALQVGMKLKDKKNTNIEEIQDLVERTLSELGFFEVSKSYILYRQKHKEQREASAHLMEQYKELLFTSPEDMDAKRENANIDSNASMAIMLKLGAEGAKVYADNFGIPDEFAEADKADILHFHKNIVA